MNVPDFHQWNDWEQAHYIAWGCTPGNHTQFCPMARVSEWAPEREDTP